MSRENLDSHKTNYLSSRYMVLDIQDSANENIVKYFKQVNNFVEEALKCGGQILIHGNAGVSRSATLVIAFIMDKYTPKLRLALARHFPLFIATNLF